MSSIHTTNNKKKRNRKMKFFTAISNRIRSFFNKITKKLRKASIDGEIAIMNAKKELEQFTEECAGVQSRIKGTERTLDELTLQIEKLERIEKLAADAGNEDDVRTAVRERLNIQNRRSLLEKSIKTNKDLYQKMVSIRTGMVSKIQNAEANLSSLIAREEMATLRKDMAKAASGISNSSSFAALKEIESNVNGTEVEADAWEDIQNLTSGNAEDLSEKYSVNADDAEVEAIVAERMAKK